MVVGGFVGRELSVLVRSILYIKRYDPISKKTLSPAPAPFYDLSDEDQRSHIESVFRQRYGISQPGQRISHRKMPDLHLPIPSVLELPPRGPLMPPPLLGLGDTWDRIPLPLFWDRVYEPILTAAVYEVRTVLRKKIVEMRGASIVEHQVGISWSRTRFGASALADREGEQFII